MRRFAFIVTEDPRFTHVPLLYSIVASLQQSRSMMRLYINEFALH